MEEKINLMTQNLFKNGSMNKPVPDGTGANKGI